MNSAAVPNVPEAMGNTKTIAPAKSWCFTCNNYSEDDISLIKEILVPKCSVVCLGFEVGESGTPHIQGYFKLLVKSRPSTIFGSFKKCHFEKCKGTQEQNLLYCQKDGNFFFFDINEPERFVQEITEFYDWQLPILDNLKTIADDRTINWVYGRDGCNGKTTFQKYIYTHFKDCLILGGKSADMKNAIAKSYANSKRFPRIILINIPKSVEHVSWGGIEEIKDMCFYSGKYEGDIICGPNPHLYIFSNNEPPEDQYSENRHINLITI